nr:M28 family metallopeptidase [uncultured Actinoplanes sp.]
MNPGLDALLAEVDGSRMATTAGVLAGAPFTGRRAGTPGSLAARAWLADELSHCGAVVTADPFPVRSVPEIYAPVEGSWHDGTTHHHLIFGRQVLPHLASADLASPELGDLGTAGTVDPRGRWLLVPAGVSLGDALRDADAAAGLLVSRAVDADGWHYTMLAGPQPGRLPVLTLDPGTHAAMSASRDGRLRAGSPIRRIDATAANLHARWPGTGTRVLLTAHYDGVGDHPGLRQPAASDNASGVAVILEAARVLGPPLPGLAVALLDAEELGALGSARHAAALTSTDTPALVINVDGAGSLGDAAAVEAGGPAHALLAVLDQAGRRTGLPLAAGPVASDNRRYAAAGLAAVGIGAGMGGYHSPADTADRVDPATLAAVCRLVVATTWLATTTLSSLIDDRR